MANELRIYQDFMGGRLSALIDNDDTTITSDGLASLAEVTSTSHMLIALDPDGISGSAPEVVKVIAHIAGATTATVQRGAEGTVGREHKPGTNWVHGPFASDLGSRYLKLSPSSDTYIDSQNATGNNDAATGLVIGSTWASTSFCRRALFTFDLAPVIAMTKPFRQASLRLVCSADSGAGTPTLRARRILRAYVPAQVTWNVYSTGNNWTSAGAKGTGTDITLASFGAAAMGVLVEGEMRVNLTELVRSAIAAGDTTLRFILGSDSTSADQSFSVHSLESATPEYRPFMEVI